MANNQPIFTSVGDVQWTTSAMTVANTTTNLAAGTIYLAFTADTTNGGYVQRIRFRTLGSNSNATVARIWINNGGATTTADNNTLFDEITLPTTTVLPLNFALPPGDRIYITLGQAPTSAGWQATVIGGKY